MQYRVNVRRFRWREFRRGSSLIKAFFFWCVTRLVQLPCSTEQPPVDSLKPHIVTPDKLPAELLAKFQEATRQLLALGFRGRVFHLIDDPINQSTHCHADFISSSGETVARVKNRVFRATTPHKTFESVELASQAADGTFVVTSSSGDDFDSPASIREEHHKKMPPAELWTLHQARLQAEASGYRTIRDARGVVEFVEDLHRANHENLVERGIFEEVQESGIAISAVPPAGRDLPGSDVAHLLHEVRRQERKKTSSLTSAVLLLLITGGLFVALGGLAWSWKFTLLLVPILLFHELGHFLCMKMFDYRNVRMFFIPLFGAAVSGRNYNVPGWKRIITSLMGPLPGIFLGLGLGIVGLVRGYDSLVLASLVMIGLNAFNLVPALPLDGGWIAHGLLFSRHAFLDLLFRVGAIGLLLVIGVAGGAWLTFGIGIAMLMGLPAAFHSARITDRLRAEDQPFGKSHADTVPEEAIARISDELDQAYPKGMALKQKAVLALQIYQNVSSPPPGVLGTLILGSVYLATILAAVVGGSILFVAHRGNFGELLAEGGLGAEHALVVQEILRNPPSATPADFACQESIVTTYADRAEAAQLYQKLLGEIGADRRLMLFGSTLIFPLSSDDSRAQRDKWFDSLEASAPALGPLQNSTFLSHADGVSPIQFTFNVSDETHARKLAEEISGYLTVGAYVSMIPPWQPDKKLTDEQLKARRTVSAVQGQGAVDDEGGAWDPEWYDKLDAATRRGRQDEVRELRAQLERQRRERDLARVARLRQLPEEYDQDVVEEYAKYIEKQIAADPSKPVESEWVTAAEWLKPLAPKLGAADEGPKPADFSSSGSAISEGREVILFLQVKSLPSTLLAIAEWLDTQQCGDIRYQVMAGVAFEE